MKIDELIERAKETDIARSETIIPCFDCRDCDLDVVVWRYKRGGGEYLICAACSASYGLYESMKNLGYLVPND